MVLYLSRLSGSIFSTYIDSRVEIVNKLNSICVKNADKNGLID